MLNNVVLQGRLVADPELRTTVTGKSVCSFRIAVDRNFSKDKQTDFISCVAWGNEGVFVSKYFHTGSMIFVVGSIQTRSYEDKAGNKKTVSEVCVREAFFGDSKKQDDEIDVPDFEEVF